MTTINKLKLSKEASYDFDKLWKRGMGVGSAFNDLYGSFTEGSEYYNLFKAVWDWDNIGSENKHGERSLEFVYAYNNYNPDKPEETIEIVSEKKWFVQKKKFNGDYKFLKINGKDLSYNYTKDKAVYFDTKDEAELWTNPLTEAVLLPVEGE